MALPGCSHLPCSGVSRAHSSQKSWQTGRWASSSPLPFLWPSYFSLPRLNKRWRGRGQMPKVTFSAMALLFGVGFWLGFIVLNGATYLLLVLMLVCNYDLPQANALKVLLIAVTTLVPIAMFASADDIFWTAGAFMSAGSLLGGHVGARLSSHTGPRMGILAPRRGDSAGACPTCLALHRAATSRPLRCREKVHGGVAHWCFCNPHIGLFPCGPGCDDS